MTAVLVTVEGGIASTHVIRGVVDTQTLDWDIWDHNIPDADDALQALRVACWSEDASIVRQVINEIEDDMHAYEPDEKRRLRYHIGRSRVRFLIK